MSNSQQDKLERGPGGTQRGSAARVAVERWPLRLTGGAARGLAVAFAGAIILVAGVAALRVLILDTPLPPAAVITLYGVVGGVATASMWILARPPRLRAPAAVTQDGPPQLPLDLFQVDAPGGRRVIRAETVEWFEACGNYARIHLPGEAFLYRMPLVQLEAELDSRRFLRVHRSAIVSLSAIERVQTLDSGDAELWLASGSRVRLSRRYASAFHERTGRA